MAPRALTSVPPLAMEVPRELPRKLPNQTLVRSLMWTAAIAAAFAGLHRNGGSFAIAQAAGQTAAYDSAMKAIGGKPDASTPLGMGQLIKETREKYRLSDLSATNAVGQNQLKSSFEEPEKEDSDEAEVEAKPSAEAKSPARSGASAAGGGRAAAPAIGATGGKKGAKKKGKQDHYDPLNAELP